MRSLRMSGWSSPKNSRTLSRSSWDWNGTSRGSGSRKKHRRYSRRCERRVWAGRRLWMYVLFHSEARVSPDLRRWAPFLAPTRLTSVMAPLRHADRIEQCPLSGVTRKTFAHTEFFSVVTRSRNETRRTCTRLLWPLSSDHDLLRSSRPRRHLNRFAPRHFGKLPCGTARPWT